VKILVTGGAGYVGSILIPKLLARGHQIVTIDIGYFGLDHIRGYVADSNLIQEDLCRITQDRQFTAELLRGCDCIIHLAAISNDPSAELNPQLTAEVNYRATMALAEAAKKRGIRFLFSSSCSVYGAAAGSIMETGALNPITAYAKSKVNCEEDLQQLADTKWRPVILRNGTLFGYSPRMRFDLVINTFVLNGWLRHEIQMFGGGRHWRPFLHIDDCASAFIFFAENDCADHLVYNVCHENLRVRDLGPLMQRLIPGLVVTEIDANNPDTRDYRVSNARLQRTGFKTLTDVKHGAQQVLDALVSRRILEPESQSHWNAKWVKTFDFHNARPGQGVYGYKTATSSY
jgi:nucleoside-diphosphate-sugar epimerase